MRFEDALRFYRRRYWQVLALPVIAPSVAFSLIGLIAAWQVPRGIYWAAVLWATYPLVLALFQWLAKTLFYTQLPAADLDGASREKLMAALEPETDLTIAPQIHVINTGRVPLLEVASVCPPRVYLSQATLTNMPVEHLRHLFTHARAKIKWIRSPFSFRPGMLDGKFIFMFSILPFIWIAQSGNPNAVYVLPALPLLIGAMIWHTAPSRPLSDTVMADKHIIKWSKEHPSAMLLHDYVEAFVMHESPAEPAGRKARLRLRLKVFGLSDTEINVLLARCEEICPFDSALEVA